MKLKILAAIAIMMGAVIMIGAWLAGSILMAPVRSEVAKPAGLSVEEVAMISPAGNLISGWWIPEKAGSPTVILVHGIRANRLAMLGRASLFSRRGYSVF